MSVFDETWDRPICEFCGDSIPYGEYKKHREGVCVDELKEFEISQIYCGHCGRNDRMWLYPKLSRVYCLNCNHLHEIDGEGMQIKPSELGMFRPYAHEIFRRLQAYNKFKEKPVDKIPQDIIDAAKLISDYMKRLGKEKWILGGICDVKFSQQ
jgi:hypothetical protein